MKRGFTLIELMLVLFVLALTAHLAVRELSNIRAARLRDAADRQLADIASAVYDETRDGPSGFLSDMGRLPVATRDDAGQLTLSELFERPGGVGEYRARPASEDNLAGGAPREIADASLYVPCGWGGPYIRLPAGTTRLADPWGNPIETPDQAGLARLIGAGGDPVATNGQGIAAVRHFGSDGLDDAARNPVHSEMRDATLAFAEPTARLLLTFEPGSVTNLFWYAPLGDKITGGVHPVGAGESQALLEGLTPGLRFIKVFYAGQFPRVMQVTLRAGRDTVVSLR